MQTSLDSSMSALRRRLAQAELKLAIAKKEATQAQRKEDRASEVVRAVQEEIAWAQLRQWGSTPDLAELMRSDGTGGMVFYKALSAIAESWGLHVFGTWSDTKQLVLSFGLNRAEQGAVERLEKAINYFAPAMTRIKGGWVRFSVSHPQPEACAWELRYAPKSGCARLARLVYGADDSVLDFASLRGALEYVEQNLWLEDIIDAPPTAALEYVIAAEGDGGRHG